MRKGSVVRYALILCLMGAFFVLPAIAYAVQVTGTVTAADTGAKLEGIRVEVHFWLDEESGYWDYSDTTDANGEYSISFSQDDGYVLAYAFDRTGVYDAVASAETTIASDGSTVADLAMTKDTRAPQLELYDESHMYYSSVAALPDDVARWAILSNGTSQIGIDASDRWYVGGRHWSSNNGSGIQNIEYALDGGPWAVKTTVDASDVNWDYSRPMNMTYVLPPLSEGIHSIGMRATDMNGNMSGVKSNVVVIDKTAPATTYNKRTATTKQLKLTAFDELAGVLATFNRTGTTGEFKYGTTISVPSSGSKTVQFYSQDKVGNLEAVKTLKVSAAAKLTTPKPSTASVSHTASFKVTGSVYSRSGAKGYVRIYKLTNGAYKYVSRKRFAEGSDGKYVVSLKLDKGTYRFRASYGGYTSTWANPPIRSARSTSVRVW